MAAAAAFALFFLVRPKPHVAPQVTNNTVVKPYVPEVAEVKPPVRKVTRRRPQPHEVTTKFYPLIEDAPPFERGELLRVSLPASSMRSVGLPVSEDRLSETVQADVLVGQEGLARAIRFVRYER